MSSQVEHGNGLYEKFLNERNTIGALALGSEWWGLLKLLNLMRIRIELRYNIYQFIPIYEPRYEMLRAEAFPNATSQIFELVFGDFELAFYNFTILYLSVSINSQRISTSIKRTSNLLATRKYINKHTIVHL